MNVEKAVLKMQFAQGFARRFEDVEQAVSRDMHRLEGTAEAMKQAAAALEQHRTYYQKAVDEEEMTFDECKLAMRVIDRCVGGLQNLMDKASLAMRLKQGELCGIRRGISELEKDFKAEQAKVEAVSNMVEYDGRPSTPASEDIQRRREEAKKVTKKGGTKPKRKKVRT